MKKRLIAALICLLLVSCKAGLFSIKHCTDAIHFYIDEKRQNIYCYYSDLGQYGIKDDNKDSMTCDTNYYFRLTTMNPLDKGFGGIYQKEIKVWSIELYNQYKVGDSVWFPDKCQ